MSDESMTPERVANEMLKCKMDTWQKISDIEQDLSNGDTRMSDIEASLSSLSAQLKKHEQQRIASTKEIKDEVSSVKDWFKRHDEKEMKKYDEIINALDNLAKSLNNVKNETDVNSKALMQKRIAEEKQRAIDDAVKEAEDKHNAPYVEFKKNAIIAATVVIVGAVLTGMWNLVMLVSPLDKVMVGN